MHSVSLDIREIKEDSMECYIFVPMQNESREKILLNAMNKRYACKRFDPNRKLNEEQLDALIESVRLTATSYGLQLMKLVVVDNPDLRERLKEASFKQSQVTDASHLFVLCRERDLDESHFESHVNNISGTRDVPRENLDLAKESMMNSILSISANDQEIWMEKQVYIALGNLLSACAILDIDACPMEGFEPQKYDEILDLKSQNLASILVCPVGYKSPEDQNATLKKVRRSKDEFLISL